MDVGRRDTLGYCGGPQTIPRVARTESICRLLNGIGCPYLTTFSSREMWESTELNQ